MCVRDCRDKREQHDFEHSQTDLLVSKLKRSNDGRQAIASKSYEIAFYLKGNNHCRNDFTGFLGILCTFSQVSYFCSNLEVHFVNVCNLPLMSLANDMTSFRYWLETMC